MGYWADLVGYTGVCRLYYRILAKPSASSFAHHGRDQIVVFVLYGYIRLADLSSLEVSLDIVFFHCSRCGICDYQYSETGNS